MNTVVTSKEEILKTSRELIQQKGWSAVNIRSVAAACGVSVGSIYNYFGSKAELVGATVEIARALITHPAVLLADEPTGALDSKTGQEILALFQDLNRQGNTIIQITHDSNVAKAGSRILTLKDGILLH